MQLSWPSTLQIAAAYLFAIGIAGVLWPLLRIGPNDPEYRAQSLAFRMGAHTRELTLSAASVVAGGGLFWHHSWARKLALVLLLIGTIYHAEAFAWGFSMGFSGGQPTSRVRLFSRVSAAAWNGLWFYLIYRLAL